MSAFQFFYEHAGYSYDPHTESRELGRKRCAGHLAHAEVQAARGGVRFFWTRDTDNDPFEDSDGHPYNAWSCYAMDGDSPEPLSSLHGIDLGPNGSPFGFAAGLLGEPIPQPRDPYCRVVEAELAAEMLVSA